MLRPTFALMNRSLRQDVRRRRFHLLRVIVVATLFLLLLAIHGRSSVFAAPGLWYFRTIAWLNFSVITIAAVGFFATAITEEKEEMTLELFVIAGISPLAILVGKGGNRLTAALTVLVVQVPFTILAVTLGGVKFGQIWAAYVSLAAYLFLAANIGLFFSVICRRSGTAMSFTGFTIGLLMAGSSLVGTVANALIARGLIASGGIVAQFAAAVTQFLTDASIVTRIDAIMQTGFNSPAASFQVRFALVAGVLLFVGARLLFSIFNKGEAHSAPSRGWVAHPNRMLRLFAPGRPWKNALVWKDFHFLIGGKALIVARLLLIPLLTAGVYLAQYVTITWRSWWDINMMNLAAVSVAVLAAELIIQASRIFSEEVKWRTLSNIAMLPQPIGEVAYGKLRGCLLGCIPAIIWLTIGVAGAHGAIRRNFDDLFDWMWLICYLAEFILFLYVVTYLSLVVRWGALPLAVVVFAAYLAISISYFSALLFGLLMTGSQAGTVGLALYNAVTSAVLTGFLHAAIGRRLRAAKGY